MQYIAGYSVHSVAVKNYIPLIGIFLVSNIHLFSEWNEEKQPAANQSKLIACLQDAQDGLSDFNGSLTEQDCFNFSYFFILKFHSLNF